MADVQDAIEFLRHANDAESENRQNGLQALQFRYGDQWPQYAIASRGLERPQLTINETNTYIKKVTNAQRQQRPRGKASPVDDFADKKIAKIITGLGRHIEVQSDADYAYDTAFDFAATIGWGYWRLKTDYVAPDSFNQDIYLEPIPNPFCVYFDWNSHLPDGSDASKALITEEVLKADFRRQYPGANDGGFQDRGTGDSMSMWITDKNIRLAEYFYIERVRDKLVMLSDGSPVWESELPRLKALLAKAGIGIAGDRESMRSTVKWCKQTGFEILEKRDLPGRWIPVVPVYWTDVVIDSRRMRAGLVKDAMDPARMNNFWWTAITESLALAPKAKWLIPEGADEGHENEYKNANLSPSPTLHFKTTGVDGQPIPPPSRVQPEAPPAGMIEAAFMAKQNLSAVMGVFDPAVRGGAQHKSDKTLNAERGQSENTNFDGYDNLTRSIKHSWRIMLSWFPSVYDVQRVARIIGEDGREQMVTLNEKQSVPNPQEGGDPIEKVLNDVRVGNYDVVMETGPGYDTKRQQGVEAMMQLLDTPLGEKVAATSDDLVLRSMDFPGADLIADRMAAANPLAQIDDKSEIPPQVQMKMQAQAKMIQDLQAKLQEAGITLKFRGDVEKMRQEGETRRTLMKETARTHDVLLKDARSQHDTEMRAMSASGVAEINALARILASHTDNAHELRTKILDFAHEQEMQERALTAKADQTEQPVETVQ